MNTCFAAQKPKHKMSKKFWNEFIQIYKENPCLWDKKCADYTSDSKKNLAYGFLVEKLWEIDDNADLDMAQLKILTMVAEYRRHKQLIELNKSSKTIKKWPYYAHFKFLDDLEDDVTGAESSSEDAADSALPDPHTLPDSSSSSKQAKEEHILSSDPNKQIQTTPPRTATPTTLGSDAQLPPQKRRRTSDVEDIEDDTSTFTAYVAQRMRSFNPEQQSITRKLISDILFSVENGELQLTTNFAK